MKKIIFLTFLGILTITPAHALTLSEAIGLAIQNNLSSKLAKAGTEEARGQALQRAAGLLPKITGSLQQSRVFKANLESEGFSANNPVFNPLLGPYNSFDARLQLVQSLLDVSAYYDYRLGKTNRKIADLQERLAREQVATATALAYIEAQRSQRAVAAAQAELNLSESLLKLARDQHSAGISTGVDVARAETNEAQEKLRLIRAQVAAQDADLRLKRVVGLPLNQALVLPDVPHEIMTEIPAAEKAIGQANHDRLELQIGSASIESAQESLRSIQYEHFPTIKALADYGHSGTGWDNTARTGSIGGRLDLPILTGGATHGRSVEAAAKKTEAEDRYNDTLIQVEEDVRLSLQTLIAESEETQTADKAVELAKKELTMARDRYASGVGDNIQVLAAQTSLDRASDDQVDAFARYDTARVNLVTALGHMAEFK